MTGHSSIFAGFWVQSIDWKLWGRCLFPLCL
jgi:hypothetical protein